MTISYEMNMALKLIGIEQRLRATAVIAQPPVRMATGAEESAPPLPAASGHQMSAPKDRSQQKRSFKAEESKGAQHPLPGQLEETCCGMLDPELRAIEPAGDNEGTRIRVGSRARKASTALEVDDTFSQLGTNAGQGLPRIFSGEAVSDQPLSQSDSMEDSLFHLDLKQGEQRHDGIVEKGR